jgi:hypothetical protein
MAIGFLSRMFTMAVCMSRDTLGTTYEVVQFRSLEISLMTSSQAPLYVDIRIPNDVRSLLTERQTKITH